MLKKKAMSLRVFNTFTGEKEEFFPVEDGSAKLYVCGVTVYDHCHIGHARSAICFDAIFRYLLHKGYAVVFVKNFTDIDDKIIKKANQEGIPWNEVAEKYIRSFYEDMDNLNIARPTYEPRATEHIEDMVAMVETLIRKGHAYEVDGDVYFSVESYKGYGGLSKRSIDEMLAGARVDIDERKRNPLDFALWKASKEGEPSWDTPFGKGRPGWHIECSVMSTKYLGNPFDIHGGGKDLIFPHHENERAQAEAATGKRFVNYWVHNGFINMGMEKMSKSTGNFLLIKDFLKDYHPEVLRLFFLSSHYRNPIEYTEKVIEDHSQALSKLYYSIERAMELTEARDIIPKEYDEAKAYIDRFYTAMDDDFNTALALSSLFELLKTMNRLMDQRDESSLPYIRYIKEGIISLGSLLGFRWDDFATYEAEEKDRHLKRAGLNPEAIEALIKERADARGRKDYRRADEIRMMLLEKGITLLDTPSGTEWRIKTILQRGGKDD